MGTRYGARRNNGWHCRDSKAGGGKAEIRPREHSRVMAISWGSRLSDGAGSRRRVRRFLPTRCHGSLASPTSYKPTSAARTCFSNQLAWVVQASALSRTSLGVSQSSSAAILDDPRWFLRKPLQRSAVLLRGTCSRTLDARWGNFQ
jgi:hypothetical protein